MKNFSETSPNKKRFERIEVEIPFCPGWNVAITGSDVPSKDGIYETVNGIHIWKNEGDDWDTLTGAGFIKVMNFIESLIKEHGIKSFVIDASDEKRSRVFKKWALRKGCTIEPAKDFFEHKAEIFNIPENF